MDTFDTLFFRVVLHAFVLYECFGQNITTNKIDSSESDNSLENNRVHNLEKPENDCSRSYKTECIRWNINKLLEKTQDDSAAQIKPGVELVWTPQGNIRNVLAEKNAGHQTLSLGKLRDYFNSVSLKIQLLHPRTLTLLSLIQNKLFSAASTPEARKKGKDGAGLIGMGMLFGGSLIMVALTALGVLAGKAITTGVLAFLFAAMTGFSALRGDDTAQSYEIVSRPVVTHGHSHSSEVQYEQHSGQGHHYIKKRSSKEPIFGSNFEIVLNKYRNS